MGGCQSSCGIGTDKTLEVHDAPVEITKSPPVFLVDLHSPLVDVNAPLDDRDIELVQETFAKVAEDGVEAVGVDLFKNVFRLSPEAKGLFPFRDEEDLASSAKAKSHARKVVSTLAHAVSHLRELNCIVPELQSFGLRHVGYRVLPEHYDVVGQALVESVRSSLGTNMTSAVTNAYIKVFGILRDTMIGELYKPKRADDIAPITVDLSGPPVDVNAPLDERDIDLVQQTFARVMLVGAESIGVDLFLNIFKIAPEAKGLFPFKDDADLSASLKLKKHGGNVVSTVAHAVSLLRDLDTLRPELQSLGLRHVGYKVVPEHYDVVGRALIESVQGVLGRGMTPAVRNAYVKVFAIVKDTMIGDHYQEAEPTKPSAKKTKTANAKGAKLGTATDAPPAH